MHARLRAWSLSFLGSLAFLLIVAVAMSIFADVNGWSSFRVALGPVVAVETTSSADESSFTLGPGLLVLAAVLATVNVAAARLLARPPRQDHRAH